MILLKKTLLFLVLSLITIFAFAENDKPIQQKLHNALNWKIYSIVNSPVKGVFQLNTDRGIFYASADGKYIMKANIYNIEEDMRDETEMALNALRLNGVKRFINDTIKFTAEKEKHVVTVFTDLSCAYCRRMHEQIDEYNNIGITIQYLAFPNAGLFSPEFDDLISVWCAKNPKQAMTIAQAGEPISAASCKHSIAEQFHFGQQIGVNGTPNIILPDGSMTAGYQSPKDLILMLNTPK